MTAREKMLELSRDEGYQRRLRAAMEFSREMARIESERAAERAERRLAKLRQCSARAMA